ncbi:MAG: hypothetical protein AAF557_10930 [Pseudomonadota bacterium]
MIRITTLTIAIFAGAAAISAPVSAQQFQGVDSILQDAPVKIEVVGVNARDESVKSAAERELDETQVYDNGAFHRRSFGGDTHSNRAARSGGNIANIFNLFGSDE